MFSGWEANSLVSDVIPVSYTHLQMRYQFAMQHIIRGLHRAVSPGYLLLRAQAVVVVRELHYIFRLAGEQFTLCRNAAI